MPFSASFTSKHANLYQVENVLFTDFLIHVPHLLLIKFNEMV